MLITSSIDGGKETRKDILSQNLCPKGGFGQLLVGTGAHAETGIFILFPDDVNYEQHTSASSRKTYVGRGLETVLSARRCGSGSPDSDDEGLTTSPAHTGAGSVWTTSKTKKKEQPSLFGVLDPEATRPWPGEGMDSCVKMLTGQAREESSPHPTHTAMGGLPPSQDESGQTREGTHTDIGEAH